MGAGREHTHTHTITTITVTRRRAEPCENQTPAGEGQAGELCGQEAGGSGQAVRSVIQQASPLLVLAAGAIAASVFLWHGGWWVKVAPAACRQNVPGPQLGKKLANKVCHVEVGRTRRGWCAKRACKRARVGAAGEGRHWVIHGGCGGPEGDSGGRRGAHTGHVLLPFGLGGSKKVTNRVANKINATPVAELEASSRFTVKVHSREVSARSEPRLRLATRSAAMGLTRVFRQGRWARWPWAANADLILHRIQHLGGAATRGRSRQRHAQHRFFPAGDPAAATWAHRNAAAGFDGHADARRWRTPFS